MQTVSANWEAQASIINLSLLATSLRQNAFHPVYISYVTLVTEEPILRNGSCTPLKSGIGKIYSPLAQMQAKRDILFFLFEVRFWYDSPCSCDSNQSINILPAQFSTRSEAGFIQIENVPKLRYYILFIQ